MNTNFGNNTGRLDLFDWNRLMKQETPMLKRFYLWLIYGDITEEPEIELNERTRRLAGLRSGIFSELPESIDVGELRGV